MNRAIKIITILMGVSMIIFAFLFPIILINFIKEDIYRLSFVLIISVFSIFVGGVYIKNGVEKWNTLEQKTEYLENIKIAK